MYGFRGVTKSKQEFPNLKKLEDKYKDKNIVFVGISCDQSKEDGVMNLDSAGSGGYQ